MARKIKNEELGRLSVQEFKEADKLPITLVLDNVRSMQNVGAMFRTADAFRLQKIILCGITATPPHRDILKTALGATETVDWQYCESTELAVQQLKEEQVKVYAVEQVEDSISLEKFEWKRNQPIALIFGHEVKGVQQSVVNECDGTVEIPQFGTKHSFNISVSAGITLWQCVSQILQKD